jgi:hypothetical protein
LTKEDLIFNIASSVASWLVGALTALWFARSATKDAQAQHLEQLEQVRKQHTQEMDLAREQNRAVLRHLKTTLDLLEGRAHAAREQRRQRRITVLTS